MEEEELVTLVTSRHRVSYSPMAIRTVGILQLPKAELWGAAVGLTALLFPGDSGVADHTQTIRAVGGSQFAQAGDSDA